MVPNRLEFMAHFSKGIGVAIGQLHFILSPPRSTGRLGRELRTYRWDHPFVAKWGFECRSPLYVQDFISYAILPLKDLFFPSLIIL